MFITTQSVFISFEIVHLGVTLSLHVGIVWKLPESKYVVGVGPAPLSHFIATTTAILEKSLKEVTTPRIIYWNPALIFVRMVKTPSKITKASRLLPLKQKSKSSEDFEKLKTTPFDDYCVKCRTLYTVCELLETNPQDANTSRQLIKYCIENLQDVQNQANLKKVRVRIPLKI